MRSLRSAINKMCKKCIYDPYQSGTWRQQVENCTDKMCPLFEYRPKSLKKRMKQPINSKKPDIGIGDR